MGNVGLIRWTNVPMDARVQTLGLPHKMINRKSCQIQERRLYNKATKHLGDYFLRVYIHIFATKYMYWQSLSQSVLVRSVMTIRLFTLFRILESAVMLSRSNQ